MPRIIPGKSTVLRLLKILEIYTVIMIFKSAYIKHSIKLKGYPRKYAGNDNRGGFLDNSNSSDVDTNSSSVQKILVKEDKNNDADGLIFHIVDQFRRQITIPSSEWTDNFRSQLGGK